MPLYRRLEKNAQLMDFKCVEFVEELLYGPVPEEAAHQVGIYEVRSYKATSIDGGAGSRRIAALTRGARRRPGGAEGRAPRRGEARDSAPGGRPSRSAGDVRPRDADAGRAARGHAAGADRRAGGEAREGRRRAQELRRTRRSRPTAPRRRSAATDRPAPPATSAATTTSGSTRARSYSVIDGQKRASIVIDPPDGRVPALTAGGARQRFARNVRPTSDQSAREDDPGLEGAGAYDDPERRPLGERCLLGFGSTSGPPVLPNYFYNNLHQIVQTHGHGADPDRDGPRRADRPDEQRARAASRSASGWAIPSAGGKATHWWSTRRTSPTRPGIRGSTENLHIVERFTRVDAKTLLYRFTVEDPEHVGEAVDRRVHVAGDRRADVRIRVPRRQLRAGQHPARRAAEGNGRREENQAVR